MFGGNSNWRGPVWMPINLLIIRALTRYYLYYGDNFQVKCPTGSGKMMNLYEVGREINQRIISTFLKDESGRRPVYGGTEKFQTDPHWRDHVLFYEYFHGDNGAGLGASHQTGWTGLVARLIYAHGLLDAQSYLEIGVQAPHVSRRAESTICHCAHPARLSQKHLEHHLQNLWDRHHGERQRRHRDQTRKHQINRRIDCIGTKFILLTNA